MNQRRKDMFCENIFTVGNDNLIISVRLCQQNNANCINVNTQIALNYVRCNFFVV